MLMMPGSAFGGASETAQSSQADARPPAAQERDPVRTLALIVVDENGVPVSGALVTLGAGSAQPVIRGETDFAGRRVFLNIAPGAYSVRVEKEGFYTATADLAHETVSLEIVLSHVQELAETLDVVYSPPPIDLSETAKVDSLTSREIVNVPHSATRDLRNLVAFTPGVVQDNLGNLHINGSAADQIYVHLDGFNVSHPTNGSLETRVSIDALRSVNVRGGRYSAEYGKGAGGVLGLETGMGDDRLRFLLTNFIPSFQTTRGLAVDNWTPRVTLSGPLRKKRAWFFVAADGEYNLDVVKELPENADRNRVWRLSNLAKVQLNLGQSNILTGSLLINRFHADHAGLTPLTPLETTIEAARTGYLMSVRQQTYLPGGAVLEIGLAVNQFHIEETPLGEERFVISPAGTRGNFPEAEENDTRRLQFIGNVFMPTISRVGSHEIKFGFDLDQITLDQFSDRRPFTVVREDGTRSRDVEFERRLRFDRDNFEASGYIQDRWHPSDRAVLELGLRLDWDQIIRRALWSPRAAASWLLSKTGETKLAAGIGIFRDATSLAVVTRPQFGRRSDTIFDDDGITVAERRVTQFLVDETGIEPPSYINWNLGVERMLRWDVHAAVELIQRRGRDGFAFVSRLDPGSGEPAGLIDLRNERRDRFRAVQITLKKLSARDYAFLVSYTRSSARSSALLDLSFGNPVFGEQSGGPLPWDAPNRLISWGWFPIVKRFLLSYSLEWRDGYPFSVVNRDQMLVGPPNSRRFPDFFSLNLHAEKRVWVFGNQFALRAGFNNITNRRNASAVNNNIDSPAFLTFSGLQDRAFTARIRFLGRK
jgi:hypothetical protein